jgi:hypothetical protein
MKPPQTTRRASAPVPGRLRRRQPTTQQKLKGIADGETHDDPLLRAYSIRPTPLDPLYGRAAPALHQGPSQRVPGLRPTRGSIPCTRGLCLKHLETEFAGCCHLAGRTGVSHTPPEP